MNGFKQLIPWWLKIVSKIILSRVPFKYSFWKNFGLFEHGDMNKPKQALNNFFEHTRTAGILLERTEQYPKLNYSKKEFAVLEIGPGDSISTAIISKLLGATQSWIVDAGQFATTDMNVYASILDTMANMGYMIPPEIKSSCTIEELLKSCSSVYLTNGTKSLSNIPSASTDYCFSNAVLEHIPLHEFSLFSKEMKRIMKSNSVSVHRVDLRDHLGGNLNNLRFSEPIWESSLFRKSGFYTNRLRVSEIAKLFERGGFSCQLTRINRWGSLPISRKAVDKQFKQMTDEELSISGFDIILRN